MASRVKEDEKNERIIRALLKQPANKRCINCNNLGPQYVCTNFWTFVCTNCSGAHREFTHRVKSVSMAKFTAQEVNALQEGGNERAREIFLKEWDPQRNSYPDSSNADKLRNFIKHVYVERRYTGERSADRPPRAKDDKEDYGESRRSDIYRGGSRSPPYNESYSESRSYSGRSDDRNSRYSYGERSPGFDQNDYKKSPRYFEVVDDRYRDDRSENKVPVQRFEERRSSEPRKPESGSPNHQKEVGGSSPPVVRPIREILGDGAPQLRVGDLPKPNGGRAIDPPKPNGTRVVDPLPQTQRTSSARSIGSAEGTSEQAKVANTISLIDFSADPEPTVAAPPPPQTVPTPPPPPQTVPTPPQQPVNAPLPQPVPQQGNSPSVSGGNWASFDAFGQQQAPRSAGTVNPLESALAQLSFSESPSSANASNLPASVGSTPKANDGGPLAMVNQSHSSLFDVSVGVPSNQASPEMTIQGSVLCAPSGGLPSQVPKNSEMTIGTQASSSSTESKSSGRKELPADFFTSLYLSAAPTMPGWQRPQFGMGYAMQYPPGMAMQAFPQSAYPQPAYPRPVYTQPAYPQPAKASNPFDLEPAPIQAPMFPSGPQGASASTTPSALPHSSSFGVPTPQWGLAQPPQQLYPPAAPPNQYLMQQVPNNIPEQLPHNMVPIQQGGLGSVNIGFDQQPAAGYSQSNTPPYGSVGGNPFG